MRHRWRVEFLASAQRELRKIGGPDRKRIAAFLQERIATEEDPRRLGHALSGPLAGYWSYRVGDFRVIVEIEDEAVTVLVVRVGNRRDIYR